MKSDSVALVIADRLFAYTVLLVLGFISLPVLSSGHPLQQSMPKSPNDQSSARARRDNGSITGIVRNERHEPIARARVQAFAAADARNREGQGFVLPRRRANVTSTTDAEGHFAISGLPFGEYLVAAESLFSDGRRVPVDRYGVTFYPSTLDVNEAVAISVFSDPVPPIQIELVPVRGVRVAGSVVSSSGRATNGLRVRLFQRFGSFGSESSAAMIEAQGTFDIPRVAPGSYRLTVLPTTPPSGQGGEFADRIIEDWSFQMTGLSGLYRFDVSRDKAPLLTASRIRVDGVEVLAVTGVELSQGSHEVIVFATLREPPKPIFDGTGLSLGALIDQFKNEKVFWRQFEIAKEIVKRRDANVLSFLVDWLNHEDRHIRGNVAFIFARFGDARGLQVITDILTDRSERPEGQGGRTCCNNSRYSVALQIRQDRYYAAHLLGELGDPEAVPVLVSFLKDPETNAAVSWALGQIGDRRAVGPLIDALDDESPTIRVVAIHGLEALHAREVLPRLMLLLNDNRKAEGSQTSVADAAKAAIATLQ